MLVKCVSDVFDALHIPMQLTNIPNSALAGESLKRTLQSHDVILSGPITDRQTAIIKEKLKGPSMAIDGFDIPQALDLFAGVVHAFSMPGAISKHSGVDIVLIRENSEGEYSQIEHEVYDGVVQSIKVITQKKSERIAEYAFEYATLSN